MRIVFTVLGNSRRSNYLNGHTIRYEKGAGSGTDGSSILIAEQLALQGHEVVFASEKLEPKLEEEYALNGIVFEPGKTVRGVTYTDFDFTGIENRTFDIIVNSLWFHDYAKLPIKVTKALIYWSHMQWIYGIGEIIEYVKTNNLKLGFVHISEWEKSMTHSVVEHAAREHSATRSTLIPNPIMDDIVNEILSDPPERKPHKFIFHAAWPRGGNVAVEAVRKLGFTDTEFHAFDYLMATHPHEDLFFHAHNGVDKKTLFRNIAESEYFVYPLYTPYQDVHKDTFSCVVAEAIALGTIVVTYPLGALPEYFGDHCVWLDFPSGVDHHAMQNEPLSKDLDGKFTVTDNIVEKIKYLEQNPQIKSAIRKTGSDYILSRFNSSKIGLLWKSFIEELLE